MNNLKNKRPVLAIVAVVMAFASFTIAAHAASLKATLILGPEHMSGQAVYAAYYDGHKDKYLLTDASSKAQAKTWHINYSPLLGSIHGQPFQYFVKGKTAKGQISVFGSEPGESDYSPLWAEKVVVWKSSVKPVLLTSDNQINALAAKGKLTDTSNGIILNGPVIKVGK